MLRIYRGNRFLNTMHFESGSTAREIGSIKIHNGQQVLFSDHWFRDIFGSNCSLKHDESIIFDDLDVSIKRKHDFNLQAFAIMDLVEPQSVYRGEKEIALYLHYDLFDFEISYNIKFDGIYKVYNSKKYSQVSFQEQITNYEKALSDYQYNTIYQTIKEL